MSETGAQNQLGEDLADLVVKQINEGLSPAEQRTLDPMTSGAGDTLMRDLEWAAAALTLAGTSPHTEPLPVGLRARIERDAQALFENNTDQSGQSARAAPRVAGRAVPTLPGRSVPASRRIGTVGWLAAAVCLLLALFGWLRPVRPAAPAAAQVNANAPSAVVAPGIAAVPAPAQERAALLARPAAMRVALGATQDPAAAAATGDAVWDPGTQRGYLHVVGLPVNDPNVRQYQLWMFDGARDMRYPVGGGVFDMPANSSEVIVPIRAALPVRILKAFAVTIERPGGVVVSARAHVVVAGAAS